MKRHRKVLCMLAALSILPFPIMGQISDSLSNPADTLQKIVVQGYYNINDYLQTTSSVSLIDSSRMELGSRGTVLEPMNTTPGVRMEQRSPGSYRLSIRGSLLRSPYGIRNIKVYLDDFSLTGASGNTYLNLLDAGVMGSMEIYKGPHSSQYGVNTGGTVLLNTVEKTGLQAGLTSGSYDYIHPSVQYSEEFSSHRFTAFGAYQASEGYREQSAMERPFLLVKDEWNTSSSLTLRAMGFYSDLHYETPGGITLEQRNENRTQARQANNFSPGSVEQQAGIYNNTFFGGISGNWKITPTLQHITALHGVYIDLKNPFVTNYEEREEKELGLRTQLTKKFQKDRSFYKAMIGFEGALRNTSIENYDNNGGVKGDPQRFDDIEVERSFLFAGLTAEWWDVLFLETGMSLNFLAYDFETLFPEQIEQNRQFESEWMPKIGLSAQLSPAMSIRGNISKGFSPPTTEEIRPSTQQIYENLRAESGWNKEIGLRHNNLFDLLQAELTFFQFDLDNAIIPMEDDLGQEFFVNAGGTDQTGWELSVASHPLDVHHSFLEQISAEGSATAYNFRFANFNGDERELNGNNLTGVPKHTFHFTGRFKMKGGLRATYNHLYTSELPLNNENSVYADAYVIGNAQASIPLTIQTEKHTHNLRASVGIQNIYNDKYSLGYDINAYGGRYYNPANERNYSVGLNWKLD